MNRIRWFLFGLLLVIGCDGMQVAPSLDMGSDALVGLPRPDLAQLADATSFPDLSHSPDLAERPDLVILPDLTPPCGAAGQPCCNDACDNGLTCLHGKAQCNGMASDTLCGIIVGSCGTYLKPCCDRNGNALPFGVCQMGYCTANGGFTGDCSAYRCY